MVHLPSLLEEIDALEARGVDVGDRLRISAACPLILPSHVALDLAREAARGKQAIGTTGRGIGPTYEDKAARRVPAMVAAAIAAFEGELVPRAAGADPSGESGRRPGVSAWKMAGRYHLLGGRRQDGRHSGH